MQRDYICFVSHPQVLNFIFNPTAMRLIISSIVLAALLVTQFSCTRKGEDDPLVSLRTRKARLTGKWKMTRGEGNSAMTYQYGHSASWTYANGTEVYINSSDGSVRGEQYYTCTVEFKTDYTFEWRMQRDGAPDEGVMKGTWDFMAGNDYDKRKTKIVLNPESVTGTWPFGSCLPFPQCQLRPIFTILELRNSALVLYREYELPAQITASSQKPYVRESYSFTKD